MSLGRAAPAHVLRLGRVGAIIALVVVAGWRSWGASYPAARWEALRQQRKRTGGRGARIEVKSSSPGASAADIAAILAGKGVVASAPEFEGLVRSEGAAAELKAGTYQLVTGMEPSQVLEALRTGPLVDVYRITIREGLRVGEMLEILSEGSGIPVEEFEAALQSGEVTTTLKDMPDSPFLQDWEGLLFSTPTSSPSDRRR